MKTPTGSVSVTLKPMAADGVGAVLLPVRSFPVLEAERPAVRGLLSLLRQVLISEWKLSCELFLQHDHLHQGDAPALFADHAKHWRPRLGLGLWPDREPPALWTREEFMALEPGQKMRKVSYKLFRLAKDPGIQDSARDIMFGLGSLLEIWLPTDDGFFKRTREFMLPAIQERGFRNYPFYAPLLDGRSIGSERANQWLCGASVYVRESPEDGGILIVSERTLEPLLDKLGARFNTHTETAWEVTI